MTPEIDGVTRSKSEQWGKFGFGQIEGASGLSKRTSHAGKVGLNGREGSPPEVQAATLLWGSKYKDEVLQPAL